jgi:LmbE family N-acetylglucosaminyl deacetylase
LALRDGRAGRSGEGFARRANGIEIGRQIVNIVVVSPHRDDAAFSLSLAIEAWLERGHAVEVVNCFTRSEHAPFSDVSSVHANDRMTYVTAVRSKEDESWRKQFGAAAKRLSLKDLNVKDGPLRMHCALEELATVAVNPVDKAMAKIQKAMEGADAVVLPLALGGHVDHRTAREAAGAIAESAVACAFYEDLPYALELDAAAIPQAAGGVGAELTPVFARQELEVDVAIKRKRRLALCYDSQIEDATAERMAAFCTQYGGRERLWGNAAWRASELLG